MVSTLLVTIPYGAEMFAIAQIMGALAFFIYGMKMMSEGIQRAAGSQLRNILRNMTQNRFLGVFTGFLTTALIQSSSATTVMTVSFVNAGLLTLVESAGIMMGANIGTTITGWVISFLGLKVKLSLYSIPLFAIGVPMLFSKKGRLKYWGEFIVGFAILFLGLSYLKAAVPDLKGSPEVLDWLRNFTEWGILSRLFFVFVGTLVTIIVQSSSAAMAVTLTMCSQGWLPFDVAAAMILGENIGTTITAELASLVGNVHAKRSARIHSMFNIIGVTWMVLLLPFLLPILGNLLVKHWGIMDPFEHAEDMAIALSAFHTVFNLANVILLIGFVPWLVKFAIWSEPIKNEDDQEVRIKFIGTASKTPELATVELQKETAHYGEVTSRMSGFARKLLDAKKPKEQDEMHKKLARYEDITDNMEQEIVEYITNLSNREVTPKTSLRLRSIMNICNDMERIGDIYYEFSKTFERQNETESQLTENQKKRLHIMMDHVDKAFEIMLKNLSTPSYDDVDLTEALEAEKAINTYRDELRKQNLKLLEGGGYDVKSAMTYNNMFSSLEKVGDHIINISEAIVGDI